jgi:hypothetical protein
VLIYLSLSKNCFNELDGVFTRTMVQLKGDFGYSVGEGVGSIELGDHSIAT